MGLFSKKKKTNLDLAKMPVHMAFIIDGNGRWAKKRGLPRTVGHKQGVVAVKNTIDNCYNLGIKEISFFCFSTENWNRPKEEIDALFDMLRKFTSDDLLPYKEKGVKIVHSGDISRLPQDLQQTLLDAVKQTENNNKMIVNLCINYGGRDDILHAVNLALKSGKTSISQAEFEQNLYSHNLHDLDLVVRTSGEQRISNFMLYQMAYAELYFTPTYWPDFDKKALEDALINFQSRSRRFGAIKE